jgi:ketosteroid isomerase-like protein
MTNLDRTKAFLRAIEAHDGSSLAYYAPDVVQRELPNALVRAGATRGLAELRAAMERGRGAVSSERYEVLAAVEQGDTVALEAAWSATLAVPLGKLAAGDTMRAHLAMFLTWRDGKIVAQRNYDCFEPF